MVRFRTASNCIVCLFDIDRISRFYKIVCYVKFKVISFGVGPCLVISPFGNIRQTNAAEADMAQADRPRLCSTVVYCVCARARLLQLVNFDVPSFGLQRQPICRRDRLAERGQAERTACQHTNRAGNMIGSIARVVHNYRGKLSAYVCWCGPERAANKTRRVSFKTSRHRTLCSLCMVCLRVCVR